MNTATGVVLLLGQVLGVVAALSGVLLLWGLGWSLLVAGVLFVAGCTAMEATLLRHPARPSVRRSAYETAGAE